jgi:hypothetical protein
LPTSTSTSLKASKCFPELLVSSSDR